MKYEIGDTVVIFELDKIHFWRGSVFGRDAFRIQKVCHVDDRYFTIHNNNPIRRPMSVFDSIGAYYQVDGTNVYGHRFAHKCLHVEKDNDKIQSIVLAAFDKFSDEDKAKAIEYFNKELSALKIQFK